MPTTSVRDDYALWLATPPVTGEMVETLEISGSALGSVIRICNRRSRPLQAFDEAGTPCVFLPLTFQFSKPAIRNSTEYTSSVRIDGLQGDMLRRLSAITGEELTQPVYVKARIYIDPVMVDRPVWRAPLKFRVESAKIMFDLIELELVGGRLATKRAGTYYVLERFTGLRPF